MDIDAVITYVNNQDPNWQKIYEEAHPELVEEDLRARYRDYGTLPYLMRGIAKNMPWVRNVYLVVKFDSQVPEWINRDEVTVVFEKDIVPEEFTPTFNSTTIEAFFHNIPGLAEHFIYFNDDMFPMLPMTPEDFFVNGTPVVHLKENKYRDIDVARLASNPANMIYSSASQFVAKRLGYVYDMPYFLSVPHVAQAFRKSTYETMHRLYGDGIKATLTKFRDPGNLAHYVYSIYESMTGDATFKPVDYAYLRLVSPRIRASVYRAIISGMWHMVCVNDVSSASESENDFNDMRNTLVCAFNEAFPDMCKYERVPQDLSWVKRDRIIDVPEVPLKAAYPHMGRAISSACFADNYSNTLSFGDIKKCDEVMATLPVAFTIVFKDHDPVRCRFIAKAPFGAFYVSDERRIVTVDKVNGNIILG